MDVLTREQRSYCMSRIKGRDTTPELEVRRRVHALGFRFRLHRTDLPGRPDIVLPRHRKVIFVHGCFWHRHEACRPLKVPRNNSDFWRKKFEANLERDRRAQAQLLELGWKVLIVWECELA